MLTFSSLSSAAVYSDSRACFLCVFILRMFLSPSKCVFWDGLCSQSLLEEVVVMSSQKRSVLLLLPQADVLAIMNVLCFFHNLGCSFLTKCLRLMGCFLLPTPSGRGTWWDILLRSPVWTVLIPFLPSYSLLPVRGLSIAQGVTMHRALCGEVVLGQNAPLGSGGSTEHTVTALTRLEEQNSRIESTCWDEQFA